MKRSELKEMILTAIREDEGTVDESFADEIRKNIKKSHDKGEKSPFDQAEPAQVAKEKGIAEADEDEEVEVEDIDVEDIEIETGDDEGDIEVKADAEVGITGDSKTVQDNLEAALIAAKELGDQKLVDQIGNSITFFTRTHVVGKDENVSEINVDIENPAEEVGIGLEEEEINESYEKTRMLRIAGIKK
jgi:hypothetical protein